MSLEQAILENTKAVLNLTAILTNSMQAKPQMAAPASETSTEAPAKQPAKTEAPAKTEPVTLEQVQKAWLKWYGKDAKSALGMLDDFGVKKVSGLGEGDYAEALAVIKAELEE